MRKALFVIPLLTLLPLMAGCPKEGSATCNPGNIRQDLQRPERYWICNQDGTGENLLEGPVAPANRNWN